MPEWKGFATGIALGLPVRLATGVATEISIGVTGNYGGTNAAM